MTMDEANLSFNPWTEVGGDEGDTTTAEDAVPATTTEGAAQKPSSADEDEEAVAAANESKPSLCSQSTPQNLAC